MSWQPRALALCGLILLVGSLFSCQNGSNFGPIPLEDTGTTILAGTVTTDAGPLPNAIVTLEPIVDGLPITIKESLAGRFSAGTLEPAAREALGLRATVTDLRGRYDFPSVEAGSYRLDVRGRDHLGDTRRIDIPSSLGVQADTTLIDIRLTPTGDIHGTVLLETAATHQGTLVAVDGTSHLAVSDPAGRYVIEGVPVGTHLVRAGHAGYLDRTVMGTLTAAGDSVLLSQLVLPRDSNIAPAAMADAPSDTVLGVPTNFSGTGTDRDGTIVRYEWDFQDDGTWEYSSPTTATTTFLFSLAGTYRARLRVLDDDGAIGVDVVTFTIIESAIFVTTTGSDTAPGTKTQPVRTIAHAISLAQIDNLDVIVAGGTYNESVTLVSDVSILGGYHPVTWIRNLGTQTSRIVGAIRAVQGTAVENVVLDGLTIESADATVSGASSYGIYLVQSLSITIRDCQVRAGRGANGTAGVNGVVGGSGLTGGAGQAGCENGGPFCNTCSQPQGGIKGTGNHNATDISGGNGGTSGLGGQVGGNGLPGQGPGPGSGGPGAMCSPNCDGQSGQVGQPGAAGLNGSPGTSFGTTSLAGYLVPAGSTGFEGQAGSGGGGGGGGSGGTADCDSYGSSGGGGGAGGKPGTPGTNGTGAGGSFAIWLFDCATVSVITSTLETEGGGTGGAAGTGGTGGVGGPGGPPGPYGGSSEQDDAGDGAQGGAGGNGGRGGHGGGGGGGPSIAIIWPSTTGFSVSGCTFPLGPPGAGGSSSGSPGATGLTQITWP